MRDALLSAKVMAGREVSVGAPARDIDDPPQSHGEGDNKTENVLNLLSSQIGRSICHRQRDGELSRARGGQRVTSTSRKGSIMRDASELSNSDQRGR